MKLGRMLVGRRATLRYRAAMRVTTAMAAMLGEKGTLPWEDSGQGKWSDPPVHEHQPSYCTVFVQYNGKSTLR